MEAEIVTPNISPQDQKLFDLHADPLLVASTLFDDFVVPPFSTLDTRQGYWQERSRQWIGLGIKSEIGRDKGLTYGKFNNPDISAFSKRFQDEQTSIFDPVLSEIMYRWFSPKNGIVLDPFAGGSVRGVIAAALGRTYIGIELRTEQVVANREQAGQIFADDQMAPTWIAGDSLSILRENAQRPCACLSVGGCSACVDGWIKARTDVPRVDCVFTCPPYADLEVYSDDPHDLSHMDDDEFEDAYTEILWRSVGQLLDDRFAVIVVGNIRTKTGRIRELTRLTVDAMDEAGCYLYNEMILQNATGTAAVRARKQMDVSRKIVKLHQTVLVFVRGNARKAAEHLGPIENEQ